MIKAIFILSALLALMTGSAYILLQKYFKQKKTIDELDKTIQLQNEMYEKLKEAHDEATSLKKEYKSGDSTARSDAALNVLRKLKND